MPYTEANYEDAIIQLLEQMGYEHVYGPETDRDYQDPFYTYVLDDFIRRINPTMPEAAISEALFKLRNIEIGALVLRNAVFTDYLQNGIAVSYMDKGEQKSAIVKLIDYGTPENNSFVVANQWTFVEYSEKRPDVILFVNGLPLVMVELKSPSRENTDVSEAYLQLQNYKHEIPSLFVYNAVLVMSDMALTKAGTITSSEDRFMEWKTVDGDYESTDYANWSTLFQGIFEKKRFLDILKNFICFSHEHNSDAKILAGYHQYFAVRKAVETTKEAIGRDGKAGVFWHTQGSGKSLSMVFYAHLLQEALNSPTIVVITDRNDLDDQLFSQFAKCKDFLRQEPRQATSRVDLHNLLYQRQANGIFFSTMQKFEESSEALSARSNIVVMTDEAHRGQYGFEHVDSETGKIIKGTAQIIRESLPNASFIGFTGTPISKKDRNTREVFGDYIDIYDMTQAVKDGATRPIYYESRVVHLKLDPEILNKIDERYEQLSEQSDPADIERSKRELSRMESILGAEQTLDALCLDIITHYEENRQFELTGKAMIVAYSRPIAISIYRKMLELRPNWQEKLGVVMTSGNSDPEDWHPIIGNKAHKEEMARKFKDNDDPLKIVIVVDMWLTGFDVPSLATMYFYKKMDGHNLMQAIARVNRVYKNKEGGLIVDYVGIAAALKQAMADYTKRDHDNYGDMDIGKQAYPKFQEKLEVCRNLFFGYDYHRFMVGSDLERAHLITGGVNFISDARKTEQKEHFIKEGLLLRQALSLCRSIVPSEQRIEAAFFDTVRTMLVKIGHPGTPLSLKDINENINDLLKQTVQSQGVINLFSDIQHEFSIFDQSFLDQLANMKERNIAVELLRKLIDEQVKIYGKTNVVKSDKFSELLQKTMNSYLNGMLTNEEVIEELLKMAKDIIQDHKDGEQTGLNAEEVAFYDAITKPQAIKDFYTNEQLIQITRELTDTLRKNRTVDWQRKESARAKMRSLIKRLLKRYNYPPEGQEEALETVLKQCEMWVDYGDASQSAPDTFSANDIRSYKPLVESYQPATAIPAEDTTSYKPNGNA